MLIAHNSDVRNDDGATSSDQCEPLSTIDQVTDFQAASLPPGIVNGIGVPNDPEDPDNDWNYHAGTLGAAIVYVISISFGLCIQLIIGSLGVGSPLHALTRRIPQPLVLVFVFPFIGIYGVILFSLTIEAVLLQYHRWLQVPLQFLNLAYFVSSYFTCGYPSLRLLHVYALGFYVLCLSFIQAF